MNTPAHRFRTETWAADSLRPPQVCFQFRSTYEWAVLPAFLFQPVALTMCRVFPTAQQYLQLAGGTRLAAALLSVLHRRIWQRRQPGGAH